MINMLMRDPLMVVFYTGIIIELENIGPRSRTNIAPISYPRACDAPGVIQLAWTKFMITPRLGRVSMSLLAAKFELYGNEQAAIATGSGKYC
jgi:hypothetical protein